MCNPNKEVQLHLDCFKYCKNKENPLIEIKHFKSGTIEQTIVRSNVIMVVVNGTLNFSLGQTSDKQLTDGCIIAIPVEYNCKIEAIKDSTLIIFRLDTDLHFCDFFSFEMLHRKKTERKKETHILQTNDMAKSYLNHLIAILNDGICCGYLLEMKLKEFLYLLGYYYSTQELKAFFISILNDDFEFSMLIWKNYLPTLTVGDLAKKVNYSVSGFEKRFKKVFDTSPAQWIRTQKTQAIYHEIKCSTKTFAELGYEFGFSSPSHFNNFCKKVFNDAPGSIRKKQ